jgi:hypothetical protein
MRPNSRADRTLADDLWDAAWYCLIPMLAGVGLVSLILRAMF